MSNTYLARAIETTDGASTYDESVKYLLADRQILAYILKYAITEFQGMTIEQISGCLGNDIEVGTRAVDPGISNLSRLNLSNAEDYVSGEGMIFYDIRFSAYLLKENKIKILLNLEAQKSTDPGKLGYHLENRIVFYLSRMISAQKLTEFYHSDYDNIKRVRAIWICMDGNGEDSIEEISLNSRNILGGKSAFSSVDLMTAVIIHLRCLPGRSDSKNKLIFMLETLFSKIELEERKRILEKECGMVMTVELERRIQTMCNISEVIIEQGIKQERINAIVRMLNANATKEQILSYGYTEDEFSKAENLLYV